MVDAEIAGKTLTTTQRLATIVDVTKREWANEAESVKEQVYAKKEELVRERSTQKVLTEGTTSPEQYQTAINNLGNVASAFLDHIKQTTGWIGFMVLGGPKPDIGGEMAVGSYVSLSELEFSGRNI
jgi:hypothetical protein